jgi:hypothetical protein
MTKVREFLTIEQALAHSLKDLKDDEVKAATNKSLSHFRKCSDPENKDNVLYLEDAVKLDILLDQKNLGTPLLQSFIDAIDKHHQDNKKEGSVSQSIMQIVSRIGKLTDVTESALDPKSPGGVKVDTSEKDKIYKALKEVEAKIATLKKAIE